MKFLREARKLTYDAVGTAVGTDGQNIFNLEKRKSRVSKFAPALADFFGVDLGALTSTDMSQPSSGSPAANQLYLVDPSEEVRRGDSDSADSDEIIELVILYQQSSVRGRQNILDFARGAAKRGAARWTRASDEA